VAHYHYARPDTRYEDIEGEVDWLLASIDLQPGEPVALDLEEGPNATDLGAWSSVWLQTVAARIGRLPMLYTYPYFIREHFALGIRPINPLWLAWYEGAPTDADGWVVSPKPWQQATIWQHTANGNIDGIAGTVVDLNRFRGTIEDFRNIGLGERELARQKLWAWYTAKPEWERGLPGEARWFDADFADYGLPGVSYGLQYEHGAAFIAPDQSPHAIQPVLWGDWQKRATIE
jgi:hypothetical protein